MIIHPKVFAWVFLAVRLLLQLQSYIAFFGVALAVAVAVTPAAPRVVFI